MRFWLVFACFIFAFCAQADPSDMTARRIEAVAGHAVFLSDADNPYVELFYEINPETLHYKKDSIGQLSARFQMRIRLSADTGIVFSTGYYLQTKPFRPDAEEAPRILEQERFAVPEGRFVVELYLAEDGWESQSFYYRDTFSVAKGKVQYSSLVLLDTFFKSATSSPFLKNGYQQLPRALNFYDEGQRTVHAYVELYRTASLPATAFPLRHATYISRRPGERDAGAYIADTIIAGQAVLPFHRSISTAALPSGNYWLNTSLRTAAGVELATAATFFQTINKDPIQEKKEVATATDTGTGKPFEGTLLDLAKTFVAKYDMAQMRAILKMIRPGADGAEESAIHAFLQKPDDLYMRYFIYNYFAQKNPGDPGKAWEDFTKVVREVNRRFGSTSIPGYETDRGIVYLRYGKPDEEVRVPNEAGALPYEIWRYNPNPIMRGPGLFLFYSPGSMSSDFRLLHSTVLGEKQNPSWRNLLYSTGRSSGNANARAEEYFGRQ